MNRRIDHKVQGGKLIRLSAEVENKIIKSIKITGDFFMHPEYGIEKIEESLYNRCIDDKDNLKNVLDGVINRNKIELLGVTEKDIIEAIGKL